MNKQEGTITDYATDNANFDWEFYLSYYNDLLMTGQEQAYNHWISNGKNEGRYPNYDLYIANKTTTKNIIPRNQKILLMCRHGTVVRFFSQMFKTFENIEFYFPLIFTIDDAGASNQNETINPLRTSHDEFLDRFDLHKDLEINHKLSTIIKHINKNYDIVIIPPFFSVNTMVRLLNEIHGRFFYYYWGNLGNIPLSQYYPYILNFNQSNLSIVFPVKQMLSYENIPKSYVAGLSFDPDILAFENTAKMSTDNHKKGMIVLSRLHRVYLPYETLIKSYDADLHCYGYNISAVVDSFKYKHEFNISHDKYYEKFARHDYFVYLWRELDMVQYSPLEAIFIGIPVFYFSNTLLAKLIDRQNWFECDTIDEMGHKINNLSNLPYDVLQASISIQKRALIYYSDSEVSKQWKKLLQL
ncbi:MAG: hypothetical protein Hyperionvirus13_53 [Hyperionvirus sp.]|uniref:Uncharacterized protein n=1 Tax=Hyperionvirus sp. TaxID=2487770 RepID=A0A3G5A9H5_9VIRU|nr:MAG: hypothetical protein Hyperionvirus13_53 [Hyperionvirus sp.]